MFVYESVPGTAVHNFKVTETEIEFEVEGATEPQITVEFEPETEYAIYINGTEAGTMKTNLGGKLVLSVEISNGESAAVKIVKRG